MKTTISSQAQVDTHLTHSLPSRSSQLDLLRTIAILLVFTRHFNLFAGEDWFKAVGHYGWIGVDLFFVLSGFLITSQLLKLQISGKSISLKDFYIRRGFRIWPNYFVILAIYFFVPSFAERGVLPPLWKFFTFTQNFGLSYQDTGAFSHAWSLCVEEQFYLLLPFVLILLARYGTVKRSVGLFTSLLIGGILLRSFLWQHYVASLYYAPSRNGLGVQYYREIYYPTYCRLDGLAIGVAIASVYRLELTIWKKLCDYADALFVIGVAVMGVALVLVQDEVSWAASAIGFPLIGIAFGCFLISALSPTGLLSKVKVPGAQFGATLAFSFYLTHKQIIHLAKNWLTGNGVASTSILFPAAIFSACLVCSLTLYLVIERPFLKWRDRLLH